MNRQWIAPRAEGEKFLPNEYCQQCGPIKTYLFKCNAGNPDDKYNVFFYGKDGIPETRDDIAWTTDEMYNPIHREGYYHPCGTEHQAPVADEFITGYIYKQGKNGRNSGERINVIVWTDNGTNTHCTLNLGSETLEPARS